MFSWKRNPYKDGLGDVLTDFVGMDSFEPQMHCFGGDGGGDSGGGGDSYQAPGGYGGTGSSSSSGGTDPTPPPSNNDDDSGGGTVFGVNGVSKTGSTAADAAIGWTSGEGSGSAGDNYEALSNATTSEVDYARQMAEDGASQAQIGNFLSTGVDTTSSATEGTAGGNTVKSVVQSAAQQTVARAGSSAPTIAKNTFDNTSGTIKGGIGGYMGTGSSGFKAGGNLGFGYASQALKSDAPASTYDFESRLSGRGDYDTEVTGMTNALVPGTSIGNRMGENFYRADAGGIVREMAPYTTNSGLVASEKGAFAVIDGSQMKTLGAKYGVPGLESMNPRAQIVSLQEIFANNPDIEIGRFDQKLGGQSVVRNHQITDYNPKTGSFMVEGGSKGFFGSMMASLFGLPLSGGASMALSGAGLGNKLQNARLDKDTGGMLGIVGDTFGLPGTLANQGAKMAGFDVNRFLPQMRQSRSYNRSIFSPEDNNDNAGGGGGSEAPKDPITAPTQNPGTGSQVSLPSVAATGLTRRRRAPGSDVYGVTTNDFPFLDLSEELEFSNLGSRMGKGRSGGFKQNTAR